MAPHREPGTRVGPYELVRLLGTGGMGEVWEACLHGPGGFRKPVALKCVAPGRVANPAAAERLLQEARLGALLQHPNVVGTLGLSRHEEVWAIALELVRGVPLSAVLRATGPLPAAAVIDIGVAVAAGLAHAHEAGLVHRDIKPDNLLVDRTGLVKIADLGVSVPIEGDARAAGTPAYMAPEQAAGHAEPASDLFSLGAVLFLLATGRRPFGVGAQARARISDVEDLLDSDSFLRPADDAVPGLGEVLRRCLRADPTTRWQRARDLGAALGALRAAQPSDSPSLLDVLADARPELELSPTPPSVPAERHVAGNLRPARDAFVGRDGVLAELTGLVLGGQDRLLVLVGPGGVGKTRLAQQLGTALRPAMTSWAFDLAEARTESELCTRVATDLGIELEARDPVGQVGRILAAKGRTLLVFDNLEGCTDLLPGTLGRWLDEAHEASFVATSRTRPRLRGEHTVSLGPLSTLDACALFHERADKTMSEAEDGQVEALCDALEGLPLAIELAAARVGLLGVEQVRRRLSLHLLAGGSADMPERHRSLAASLDWSCSLLSPGALDALIQLTSSEGTFSLDAAEAVLDLAPGSGSIQVISELADASLLRVDAHTSRFSMLGIVRGYGRAREPEAVRAAQLRHGAYFAQLGSPEALTALDGPAGPARTTALALELDNLVAACRRAVERTDAATAVACLRAAWAALEVRGPFRFATELAENVLRLPTLTDRLRVEAALVAARSLRLAGEPRRARQHLAAVEPAIERTRDGPLKTRVLGELGIAALIEADPLSALAHHTEELAGARAQGDRRAEGMALCGQGSALWMLGRVDDAQERFNEGLTALRAVGSRRFVAGALGNLGEMLRQQGRLEEARAKLSESVTLLHALGSRGSEATSLGNLANVLFEQGHSDEALTHYEAALEAQQQLGDLRSVALLISCMGVVHQSADRLAQARDLQERSLAIHRELANPRGESVSLSNLGSLCLEQGHTDVARGYFEQALVIAEDIHLRRLEGHVLCELARLQRMCGDLPGADVLVERSLEVLRQIDARPMLADALVLRAELRLRQGDPDAAQAAVDEAEGLEQRSLDLARALIADQVGAPDAALRHSESVQDSGDPRARRHRLRLEMRYDARSEQAIGADLTALLEQARARQDVYGEARVLLLLARCTPEAEAFEHARAALALAGEWRDIAAWARLLLRLHGGIAEGAVPDDPEAAAIARLASLRRDRTTAKVVAAFSAVSALRSAQVPHVLRLAGGALATAGVQCLAHGAGPSWCSTRETAPYGPTGSWRPASVHGPWASSCWRRWHRASTLRATPCSRRCGVRRTVHRPRTTPCRSGCTGSARSCRCSRSRPRRPAATRWATIR